MNKSDLIERLPTMTLDEIGREYGISRQGVHYFVKKYGLTVSKIGSVEFKCDTCGKTGSMYRGRFNKSKKHFCSFGCYKGYLHSQEYRDTRVGTSDVEVEQYL